jgi:hypothetical protein
MLREATIRGLVNTDIKTIECIFQLFIKVLISTFADVIMLESRQRRGRMTFRELVLGFF